MQNPSVNSEEALLKKRILVVDDDLFVRELLRFKLSRRGFEVLTAKNEKEFWNCAFVRKPDLIVLDLWFHGKIGAVLYDQLIDFGFDPNVPVIFITGHIQTGSSNPIRVKKRQVFLTKPFDFDQLNAEVNRLLNLDSEKVSDLRVELRKINEKEGTKMKRMIEFACFVMIILPLVLGQASLAYAKGKPGGMPKGFEKGEKKGWGESQVPPGWERGKKKGWDDKETPPGLEPEETEEATT